MIETNCSIGIFLSTPSVEQYIAEYRNISAASILTTSSNFGDALKEAREWEKQGVEVFISRRGTGEVLRQNLSTPVLSLPFSEMEIILSLREHCSRGTCVLIPMHKEPYSGLALLEELIGVSIIQSIYTNFKELDFIVQNAMKAGANIVAGGGTTQRLAQKYGIPSIDLSPSREQCFTVLDSACNVVASHRERNTMIQEMQCMMNAMADGFLSVNLSGTIINVNATAVQLLQCKTKEELCGTSIVEFLGKEVFNSLLQNTITQQERLIDIKDVTLVVSVSLITSKYSIERILITLRKAHDVIRQSGTIRSAIFRGFKANYHLKNVIHKSSSMCEIINVCKAYSKIDSSVLVYGETGTGKEMLAQGIHNLSKRSKNPFVSVNCAELPEHLLESELFGYDEGAFTGSRKGGKSGFFELAHCGTILLDEIDSASNSVQSKLLRVLQEKEIMRIGGRRKIPIDVRVLATSGRDLWEQVCLGGFRKDLFFRLNVMTIRIPPLRERIEDIDVLLPHFINCFVEKETNEITKITREQLELLKQYLWPGNVRQLRHFVERFVVYSSFMEDPFWSLYTEFQNISFFPSSTHPVLASGASTHFAPMPAHVENVAFPASPAGSISHIAKNNLQDQNILQDILDNSRRALDDPNILQMVLAHARYSKKEAARLLGVSRSTLWRKLTQFNLN